jgi:tetratricopeptide (TPR) repeat protein
MWLDRLETEHDNFIIALEYALESNIESQLRIASALLWFWWIRSHKNEGIDWLERGLSIDATERGEQHLTPRRAMIRGKALNSSGFLIMWTSDSGKAEAHLEESLALFQNLGYAGKQGMAHALLRLGQISTNDNRESDLVEQSLALFREIGDKFGVAECLVHLAGNFQTNENFQLLMEEYLAVSREIGDQDSIAGALEGLANFAYMENDYQRAITLYEESLAGFRTVGNNGMVGLLLSNLGRSAQASGDYELAVQQLAEALTMLRDFGLKVATAITLRRLGQSDWSKGNYAQATQKYEEALSLLQESESRDQIASVLYSLGKVAWVQGKYQQADQWYEKTLILGKEMENKFTVSYALYGLGKVAQARSDYTSARSFQIEALTIRRGMSNRRTIAYSLDALAALSVTQQKAIIAARLFGAVENLHKFIRFTMSPYERAEHDQAVSAARAALGEEAFAAAYEEGKKMTLDEAVAYALGDVEANVG